jgi:hypothetical protein
MSIGPWANDDNDHFPDRRSDHADEELFAQKARWAPIKMEVDAILILHGWILEGEAADAGELLVICTLWGIRRSTPNSHGQTNRFQSFGEYSGRNQINLGVTNSSRPHAGWWLTIEAVTSNFDSEIEAELRILFQQRTGDVAWPRFISTSGNSVAQQRLRRSSFAL